MWDPSAMTEADIDEMVRWVEQPGGTAAILEMYRARLTMPTSAARSGRGD